MGNLTSVVIIKFIGMSVGMAIWNVGQQFHKFFFIFNPFYYLFKIVGIIVGWVFSRFGFLGSTPQGF